ncbi:metallophosphoesterase [Clostridium oryzae]|uniref:Calcineurin-like phosphoesterase n=1 Tax=Clostridium oryzae TaxID=1450648 RepID=A0A1V4I830_9CLOT|nr:metallophosphoesterase [Clostridium oryzae]OPJ56142.1 calcineurin-like phosphoesterase [Clostridium oryzae]
MSLNSDSTSILIKRIQNKSLSSPKNFSIIFIGDTHVGKVRSHCNHNEGENYKALLKKINKSKNKKEVIAIIHGGDGCDFPDKGKTNLKDFVDITKSGLEYKNIVHENNKIPFFMNVGNHEYNKKTSSHLKEFGNLIGKRNYVVKLFDNTNGPMIAVVLLQTGMEVYGGSLGGSKLKTFKDAIEDVEAQMEAIKSNNKYKSVKFIIDMHIPPTLPVFNKKIADCSDPPPKGKKKAHSLCIKNDNTDFINFINRFTKKYKNSILAIVCHHKHWYFQPNIRNNSNYMISNVPVFITAQGGNCHRIKKNAPGQFSYYELKFSTTSSTKKNYRKHYKLNKVYRMDLDIKSNKLTKKIKY